MHHTVSRGLCPTGPSCEKKKAPESHRRRPPSVEAGPCCGQSHYLIAFSLSLRLFSSFLSFFSAGQRTISFCSFSSLFRNALDNRNEPSFIAKAPQITQPHTRDVSAKNTRWACGAKCSRIRWENWSKITQTCCEPRQRYACCVKRDACCDLQPRPSVRQTLLGVQQATKCFHSNAVLLSRHITRLQLITRLGAYAGLPGSCHRQPVV